VVAIRTVTVCGSFAFVGTMGSTARDMDSTGLSLLAFSYHDVTASRFNEVVKRNASTKL